MSTRSPHVPALSTNVPALSPKHSPPHQSSKSKKHTSQSRKVAPTPDVSGSNDEEHKGRRGHTKAGKTSAGANGTLPQSDNSETKNSRNKGMGGGVSTKGSLHPHTKSGDLTAGVSRKTNPVKENSGGLKQSGSLSTKGRGASQEGVKDPALVKDKNKSRKNGGRAKEKSIEKEIRRSRSCGSWLLSQLGLRRETVYLQKAFAKEAATALNLQQWHLQKVFLTSSGYLSDILLAKAPI